MKGVHSYSPNAPAKRLSLVIPSTNGFFQGNSEVKDFELQFLWCEYDKGLMGQRLLKTNLFDLRGRSSICIQAVGPRGRRGPGSALLREISGPGQTHTSTEPRGRG